MKMSLSKRNRPSKTRLKKASSYIDNHKRMENEDTRREQLEAMLKGQSFVDVWNTTYVGKLGMDDKDLTEHFKHVQLEDGLVIQMFMENPVKEIARNSETGEVVHLDYYIRQIDARVQITDKPHWVPTPFPVIDKGVIMAISPRTMLWYYEQQEKLAKYDKEAADKMVIPAVGDIVYTKHFQFKDKRYYVDKQAKCKDLVKNQLELRLKEFDMLFLIDNYDIESIVKKEMINDLYDKQIMINDRYIDITPDENGII
jgi:hypothetical protein